MALSAGAILAVLAVSGIAVVKVLGNDPEPREEHLLTNAELMASVAGTDVGADPSAPASSEVDITGITFVGDVSAVVHAMPDGTSEQIATVPAKSQMGTTGTTHNGFSQVIYAGKVGWVKTSSLVTGGALSGAPCASGDGVEKGLQRDTILVHRVACAGFPQVTRYGGVGGGGEHATGRALDIMVGTNNVQLGTTIAIFMRQHAAELGISQVIWRQHIWTTQMAGGGWRSMSDRGSPTANHMDHVHVTTYGNRGTI